MPKTFLSLTVGAMALLLAACGGGGSGSSGVSGGSNDGNASGEDVFAKIECDVASQGPFAGPLDDAQATLIEQTANAIGSNEQLGEAGVNVVIGVSRLLDLVDALATLGDDLATEQDPQAAFSELLGVSQAVQCGAASLADAAESTELANLPFARELIDDLRALALGIDTTNPQFLGASGLEDLTRQLADISETLSKITATIGLDPGLGLPKGTQELLRVPTVLFADLADTLTAVGQLDGDTSSDVISATVVNVLEGVAALSPNDAALEPLAQAEAALADGLAQLLVPLFDAIAQQLNAGGRMDAEFGQVLAGGFTGTGAPVLGGIIAGGDATPDGVPRPEFGELLAGLPVLGDILATVLSAEGFETGGLEGLPLISELLSAGGGRV